MVFLQIRMPKLDIEFLRKCDMKQLLTNFVQIQILSNTQRFRRIVNKCYYGSVDEVIEVNKCLSNRLFGSCSDINIMLQEELKVVHYVTVSSIISKQIKARELPDSADMKRK